MPWRLGGAYFGLRVLFWLEMAQYLELRFPVRRFPLFPSGPIGVTVALQCGIAFQSRLAMPVSA